jgi:hypothetical protein
VEVGGRSALLTHPHNAHTDGDTWVYFADATVLDTGGRSRMPLNRDFLMRRNERILFLSRSCDDS